MKLFGSSIPFDGLKIGTDCILREFRECSQSKQAKLHSFCPEIHKDRLNNSSEPSLKIYRWGDDSKKTLSCGYEDPSGLMITFHLESWPVHPMKLIFNYVVRADAAWDPDKWPSVNFPNAFEIDYIRVYEKKKNTCDDLMVLDFQALIDQEGKHNWLGKRRVYFDLQQQELNSNQRLNVEATEFIEMNAPGGTHAIEINNGAYFTGEISNQLCTQGSNKKKDLGGTSDQEKLVKLFQIYPNPAGDFINIKFPGVGVIEIFDNLGKLIFTENVGKGDIRLDLKSYSSGFYTVKYNNEGGIYVKKFIKS